MQTAPHYHVASGSYYISRQKPLILDAYLGTCVGVALYDEETGVGGLIHLLLPEPCCCRNRFPWQGPSSRKSMHQRVFPYF